MRNVTVSKASGNLLGHEFFDCGLQLRDVIRGMESFTDLLYRDPVVSRSDKDEDGSLRLVESQNRLSLEHLV